MSTRVWIIRPHGDAWCVPGRSKQWYPSAMDRQKNPQKLRDTRLSLERWKVMTDAKRPTSKSLNSSSDLQLVLACFYPHLHTKSMHTLAHTYICLRARTHCTDQKKKMKRRKMSSFVPKTYLHPALCQISDLVYFMFWDFLHQFKVNRRQEVKDRGLHKLVYRSFMTLNPFMLSRKPVTSSSGSYGNLRRALCWETDFWTKKESF